MITLHVRYILIKYYEGLLSPEDRTISQNDKHFLQETQNEFKLNCFQIMINKTDINYSQMNIQTNS